MSTTFSRRAQLGDLLARAVISGLFLVLAINLFGDFQRTGRFTGLLLLISELLVAIFTLTRRQTSDVDRTRIALLLTAVSVAGPPLLRTSANGGLMPDAVTAAISAVGLLIVVFGKLALGRSFGIVPANRGVVTRGPYAFVRHPIYTGYLITHVAFLAAHPSLTNLFIVLVADTALIGRAFREEQTLEKDDCYQAYRRRVAWHLVPGVF
ncbi:MAG TPA: isoprenylcysteine carboxylmethyltransferase family protein [Vicinamibacterales bacterium]|nr:isoprenylcysteine carboxylmethyltransferase family protein [Vicinamibacterales bacterium]